LSTCKKIWGELLNERILGENEICNEELFGFNNGSGMLSVLEKCFDKVVVEYSFQKKE